jgi:hypothetical protein
MYIRPNKTDYMRKLFFLSASLIIILSSTSCTKKCVHCTATDKFGVVVVNDSIVCEYDPNRSNFEASFKQQFIQYTTKCTEQ